MSLAPKIPTARDLIRDYGAPTRLRCSLCRRTGTVYEIAGYGAPIKSFMLCSWCDVEPALRWT